MIVIGFEQESNDFTKKGTRSVQGVFNEATLNYRKLDELLMNALLRPDFFTGLMTFAMQRQFHPGDHRLLQRSNAP